MFNGKLNLNIKYLEKNYEIALDNNSSFEDIKSNIIKELNITENHEMYIKIFDIKYEKIDSENSQLKLELLNTKDINTNLEQTNEQDKDSMKDKDGQIEQMKNEIEILRKDINLKDEQNQKNIKEKKEELEKMKNEILSLKNNMAQKEEQNKQNLKDKDEQIEQMKNQIDSLKNDIIQKDLQMDLKKKEIETLKNDKILKDEQNKQIIKDKA